MRTLIIILLGIFGAAAAAAGGPDPAMSRADRSFEWHEWPSAAAMYELELERYPDSLRLYARAIAASEMAGDTVATVELPERAMAHGIGLAEVLRAVRTTEFAIGYGDVYGAYLLRLRDAMPWLRRALDNELLDYYTFRRDGARMVQYATIMLRGLPDSTTYLNILAQGYLFDGQDARAESTWLHILELDPDNVEALLYLGNLYAMQGQRDKAEPLLRRAEGRRPTPYLTNYLSNE